MTSNIDCVRSFGVSATPRPLNRVAVVSRDPHVGMLDALRDAGDYDVVFIASLHHAGNYDVVFIASLDHAYSQIKRSIPQVVVMCLDMDDAACFQVLAMLTL